MNDERLQRQAEMLREMGIAPLWRRRVADAAITATATAGAVAVPVPQAPAVETAAMPDAVQPPLRAPAVVPLPDAGAGAVAAMDWHALRQCVTTCTGCALHKTRNQTVFGVGDEQADWLFVGEGPGADEDAQGEPFVGQAGRLLDNMLAAIDLKRDHKVYIANVVKCRPPGNRNPEPAEAAACAGYLQRQIELIRPRLIVALGKVAAVHLLGRDASIAGLRGTVHQYRGIPLIVTYHPAYLLRTLPDKARAWEDLCFARETMRGLVAGEAALPASTTP